MTYTVVPFPPLPPKVMVTIGWSIVTVVGCNVTYSVTVVANGLADEAEEDEEEEELVALGLECPGGKVGKLVGKPKLACLSDDVVEDIEDEEEVGWLGPFGPNGPNGEAAARGRATVRRVMSCIVEVVWKGSECEWVDVSECVALGLEMHCLMK